MHDYFRDPTTIEFERRYCRDGTPREELPTRGSFVYSYHGVTEDGSTIVDQVMRGAMHLPVERGYPRFKQLYTIQDTSHQ